MKIGKFDVTHRRSVCDITISDGVYNFALTRDEASEIAKQLAYYAEHGHLKEPMKRWVLGWNSGQVRIRLNKWDGFVPVSSNRVSQPIYFEREADANIVNGVLYGSCTTDPPGVIEVTVVERDGKLVEIDE